MQDMKTTDYRIKIIKAYAFYNCKYSSRLTKLSVQ